jgi:16S rRNA (guanine966-N2)-methyltransferase
MRIIAGSLKTRKIITEKQENIKPTTSKLREIIFNIITHNKYTEQNLLGKNIKFLDIFSGTGIMTFEAISRGIESATIIEKNRKSNELIAKNAEIFGISNKINCLQLDASNLPIATQQYDLCFIDPPYEKELIEKTLNSLITNNWLNHHAILFIEYEKKLDLTFSKSFTLLDTRKYGNSKISIIQFNKA